jgi:hypothetical protein
MTDYGYCECGCGEVLEIKALPGVRAVTLGDRYRVSRQTINNIRSGRAWRSVA